MVPVGAMGGGYAGTSTTQCKHLVVSLQPCAIGATVVSVGAMGCGVPRPQPCAMGAAVVLVDAIGGGVLGHTVY